MKRHCRRKAAIGVALIAAAMALPACMSGPKMAAAADRAAAASETAASQPEHALAASVTAVGSRGQPLTGAEREQLIRRLGSEGSATLLKRQLAAMSALGDDVHLHTGNEARVLVDGPATFDAIFAAVAAARHSIVIESYIVEDAGISQRLAKALTDKRRQGVQVALLYDAVGSFGTDEEYFTQLRDAGVGVCAFNPAKPGARSTGQSPTHRDHRKIVVVDRRIGFTGGINISAVYSSGSFGSGGRRAQRQLSAANGRDGAADSGWRDTHLQLRGPVAAALDDLVRRTWREQRCDGGALPLPPAVAAAPAAAGNDVLRIVTANPDDEKSRIYALLMAAIASAQRSVHLTMAYFAPGDEMMDALCEAARRGTDVQLVLPSRSDFSPVLHAGRAYYTRLLEAGVRVHELQGTVLHAKTGVIDGVLSTVGSSNLDFRSFDGNNEVNAVVLGEDFGTAMEALFRQDVGASREITRAAWTERTLLQRLKETAAAWLERWW